MRIGLTGLDEFAIIQWGRLDLAQLEVVGPLGIPHRTACFDFSFRKLGQRDVARNRANLSLN